MRSKKGFLLSESIIFMQVCMILVLFLSVCSQSIYKYLHIKRNTYDEELEMKTFYEEFRYVEPEEIEGNEDGEHTEQETEEDDNPYGV
ncbi:hypothetical protein EDD63_11336 [Breznakia blatticola]|uniref:Uncharacterized protein n=1 Tax=Breznakia blatticola TaxID=1754012 RepID=A0A4R7ZRV6_9FIRM|nr:hypothetical protein [Breznakia blatticola]TDW20355.1 hypothetical protein EDD63_11336 [Breznakia blatticola]